MPPPPVLPVIPISGEEPFVNPDQRFKFKYEGYRSLRYVEQSGCQLLSRNGSPTRLRKAKHARRDKHRAAGCCVPKRVRRRLSRGLTRRGLGSERQPALRFQTIDAFLLAPLQ